MLTVKFILNVKDELGFVTEFIANIVGAGLVSARNKYFNNFGRTQGPPLQFHINYIYLQILIFH